MAAKKLWLSRVDDTYTPQDAVVGPWCFEGAEDVDPAWFQRSFDNPLDTDEALIDASKNALALFDHLSQKLAVQLNQRHGLDHSHGFWRHVLAGWLAFLIHVSWVRYLHITACIKAHEGEDLSVAVAPKGFDWSMGIAHDLIKNAPMPDFDFWLSSFMVQKMQPVGWTLQEVKGFSPDVARAKYRYDDAIPFETMRDKIRYPVRKALYAFLKSARFGNVYGTTWRERVPLSLYLSFKPAVKKPVKPAFQKSLIDGYDPASYFPQDYLDLLNDLIDTLIPRSLTTDFMGYYDKAKRHKFKAGKIRVSAPDVYKEVEKLENALAAEAGELVLQSQHGSWYGMVACSTVPQAAEYGLYGFLTWGWAVHDDLNGNFIPAPSPMLASHQDSYHQTNDKLLFVNNKTYTRSSRLEGQPMPAQTVQDRLDKVRFLQALDDHVRADLLYRPHMHHSLGLKDEDYITSQFDDVELLLIPSMNDYMMGCKLFVANHYSTGLHIAMAANIPSISFWPKGMMPIAQSAMPEHQRLIDNKMMFDCPEKAAAHINAIWSDVDAWWKSEAVQAARLDWCRKFSYTKKDYMADWKLILSEVGQSL